VPLSQPQIASTIKAWHLSAYGLDYLPAYKVSVNTSEKFQLTLDFPPHSMEVSLKDAFLAIAPHLIVEINWRVRAHQVQPDLKRCKQIKNIVAVASGKGGVGKSTVATNLAVALSLAGAKVGLVDADIYGPSQPQLLGEKRKPAINQDKKFIPRVIHGIEFNSMGLLVEEEAAMIWRGPMASGAVSQLIFDTAWGVLDYLLVDLPPGTGDIQLTLAQKVPLAGAIIVTTPQDLALMDARRAYQMFQAL